MPGTPVQILSYHPLGRFTGIVVCEVDLGRRRPQLVIQFDDRCGFVTSDPRITFPRDDEE